MEMGGGTQHMRGTAPPLLYERGDEGKGDTAREGHAPPFPYEKGMGR